MLDMRFMICTTLVALCSLFFGVCASGNDGDPDVSEDSPLLKTIYTQEDKDSEGTKPSELPDVSEDDERRSLIDMRSMAKPSEDENAKCFDSLNVGFISLDMESTRKRTFRDVQKEFEDLIVRSTDMLNEQGGIIEIEGPTAFVGDLHGDIGTLEVIIDSAVPKFESGEWAHIVFLGDILDRGPSSSETLMELLKFFNKYPDKVHIIRGNHETMAMYKSFAYPISARIEPLFRNISDEVMENFFDSLPYAAVINRNVLAVHGGISNYMFWVDFWEGKKIKERDHKRFEVIRCALWSDYDPSRAGMPSELRGFPTDSKVVCYDEDLVRIFIYPRAISYMVRAHQPSLGTFFQSEHKVVTSIFTAVNGQDEKVRKQGGTIAFVEGSNPPIRLYSVFSGGG